MGFQQNVLSDIAVRSLRKLTNCHRLWTAFAWSYHTQNTSTCVSRALKLSSSKYSLWHLYSLWHFMAIHNLELLLCMLLQSVPHLLEHVKRHNIHLILGDFNARIGLDSHASHPWIIGLHCYHDSTNDNGERLINICQEQNLRPAQMRFPQPRNRLWTWTRPNGTTYQLDHILIRSNWVNSLRTCRAYNSVESRASAKLPVCEQTKENSARSQNSTGRSCKTLLQNNNSS